MRVKICGLRSEKDVETAVGAGADAVGFLVGQVHASPDFILSSTARRLAALLPPFVTPVLVTHLTNPGEIFTLLDQTGLTTLQLHGGSSLEELSSVRENTEGEIKLIFAAHVMREEGIVPDPLPCYPFADAILLDSANPLEGRVGGTGLTHDWNVSERIAASSPRPVILAGGLSPENVGEAIRKVRPYAVDANSRLRNTDGSLDPARCAAFVANAKRALEA